MDPRLTDFEQLARQIEAGDLAGLSAEQIERLAEALDADPAPTFASRRAAPDAGLRRALDASERPALPTTAQWDAMWARIEAAPAAAAADAMPGVAPGRHARSAAPPPETAGARLLRLWRPLGVAVAAGLALAAIWARPTTPAPPTDDWPLRLASDVQINALEVSEGTPFIVSLGEAHGPEVIWVLSSVEADG
jgi:hypothetical protein